MASPHDQSQYQVRFDWGAAGIDAVATDVDVVVWVDLFDSETPVLPSVPGVLVAGGFTNRTAVAEWVLARQAEKGDRFTVAVVASGAVRGGGSTRFAVEHLLAAGAIVDALAELGIDYSSPEAAAAAAAFSGLRNAIAHLVSASGSGRELAAAGRADEVAAASRLDSSLEVRVLQE
ncbi:MAG: 2-phosphosulfolactate phosphatase [Cryobacterium sp.]|nr:2-phosphosulfolactate phosphatase [Cryobacterium sp.]